MGGRIGDGPDPPPSGVTTDTLRRTPERCNRNAWGGRMGPIRSARGSLGGGGRLRAGSGPEAPAVQAGSSGRCAVDRLITVLMEVVWVLCPGRGCLRGQTQPLAGGPAAPELQPRRTAPRRKVGRACTAR